MKIQQNYLIGSICMLAILLVISSCSSEYEYKTDYSAYKNAQLKVNLVDENNTLQLKYANGTHQITIGVVPENLTIDLAGYIYQVSDESIATISQSGLLTMIKEGETELTVRFRGLQEVSTTCKVKITRDPILVSDIKAPEKVKVQEFKTLNLYELITVLPASADNKTFNYVIADETIATIDKSGVITGVHSGSTTVTLTTTDGTNISRTVEITVVGEIKVSKINLNSIANLEGKKVAVGQLFNLGTAVEVLPVNASNQDLTYTAEGNAVTVDSKGVVTTVRSGSAKVTIAATDGSGVKAQVSFTVDATITLFERALWKVSTSITYANGDNYVKDGSTGMPEHILDGNARTYLSLVKPGKSYNGCVAGGLNVPIFFVVDLGKEQTFSYFKWAHRDGNQYDYLRVWGISLYGSNDGFNFTEIQKGVDLPYASATALIEIDIPTSTYRYVKIGLEKWSDIAGGAKSGSNMQISEFNVGKR